MSAAYRSREEIRQIIRAIIAESKPPPLRSFNFQPGEEEFFRARTARFVDYTASKCASFKAY